MHGRGHHVEKLVRGYRRAGLPAEMGALVLKALERAMEELPRSDDSRESCAGQRAGMPTRVARRADARGVVAESFLQHGAEALTGGERQQIVVHVDAETLKHRSAGRCELEDGPCIAVETARRLACDSSIQLVHEGGIETQIIDDGALRFLRPETRRAQWCSQSLHRQDDRRDALDG